VIGLIIIVLLFLFVYLVVLRPQRRRRLEQAQRLQGLHVGDEVLTAGGIYGTITQLEGEDLIVEIAPSVEIRLDRRAIGRVIEPPEPDALEEHEAYAADELEEPREEAADTRTAEGDGSYSEDPR
jgi:preprotein translocase subunit YajC